MATPEQATNAASSCDDDAGENRLSFSRYDPIEDI
jgi:hypothetical protein